jgi:hypothetical protein
MKFPQKQFWYLIKFKYLQVWSAFYKHKYIFFVFKWSGLLSSNFQKLAKLSGTLPLLNSKSSLKIKKSQSSCQFCTNSWANLTDSACVVNPYFKQNTFVFIVWCCTQLNNTLLIVGVFWGGRQNLHRLWSGALRWQMSGFWARWWQTSNKTDLNLINELKPILSWLKLPWPNLT